MIKWQQVINALGKSENSEEFALLKESIGEKAEISEDPIEYNDPEKSKYYKFFSKGIEISVINSNLKQIHLYLIRNDSYSQYKEALLLGVNASYSEMEIINLLGKPTICGSGKQDQLLGYINKWIAYYIDNSYSLRFEFNQSEKLSAVTLIKL